MFSNLGLQIFIRFVACFASKVILESTTGDTSTFLLCDYAKRTYESAGYEETDIHTIKQNEDTLKVCGKKRTCCKRQAEFNLANSSAKQSKDLTVSLQRELKQSFEHMSSNVKDLFRSLITKSQNNLDVMFERIYGKRYENNTQVFKALYTAFNLYLSGSELDLTTSVNTFFAKLHEKIYVMSQPWSTFDKKYENCIFESTNFVRPFGDVQRKIAHQIARSFLASRVFLQGVKEGMDIIMKLLQLPVHQACSVAFMKMTQCSICSGISQPTKPCSKYCTNVMKGCFAYIIMVQPKWNEFIDGMISLADKLEGPFSMEAVTNPLAVKLSGAVMVFQENQANITNKVESKCGKPAINNALTPNKRRRRFSRGFDTRKVLEGLKTESKQLIGFKGNVQKPDSSNVLAMLTFKGSSREKEATELEKLLKSSKATLSVLRDYWILLPQKLCDGGLAADTNATSCWNGHNTSGYTLKVVANSVHDLFHNNPEFKTLDAEEPKLLTINQVEKLGQTIGRIKAALKGQCFNCDDESFSGSGSGQPDEGSGSGVEPTDPGSGEGSGNEPTTAPVTQSRCENSVNEDCKIETIRTSASPNSILDDSLINIHGSNIPNIQAKVKGNTASVTSCSFMLLILGLAAAIL